MRLSAAYCLIVNISGENTTLPTTKRPEERRREVFAWKPIEQIPQAIRTERDSSAR